MFTKEDILDYIMSTPENTNRQVLQYMLDDISGGGEGNIPLPEYKSTMINDSESGFTLDLHPGDIEEFSFIEVSTLNETIYVILDYNTNSGIVFNEYGITHFIRDIDATLKGTNIVCYTESWPPQGTVPEYEIWTRTSSTINYESYEYPFDGGTVNGFITDPYHITSWDNMDFLSYVQIEPIGGDNSSLFTYFVGVVNLDNEFIDAVTFYDNWNTDLIDKREYYTYVFTFKNMPPIDDSGQCKITLGGIEEHKEK